MYGRSELIFLLHSNILNNVLYIFSFTFFFYILYNIFFRFLNEMFKVRNILGVI